MGKERQMRHLDERARLLAEVATTTHSSCFEMSGLEMELQALENKYGSSDVEDGDDSTYCVACNKQLRSERAYSNHLKQKKHRENVAALRELLMEDSTIVPQKNCNLSWMILNLPLITETLFLRLLLLLLLLLVVVVV